MQNYVFHSADFLPASPYAIRLAKELMKKCIEYIIYKYIIYGARRSLLLAYRFF
jgi:hypothetical protein